MIRDVPAEIYPGYMTPSASEAAFLKRAAVDLKCTQPTKQREKSNSGITKAGPWRNGRRVDRKAEGGDEKGVNSGVYLSV